MLLTDRELEIFQLIGQGKGTREIASQLGRSVKTIETHRATIMKKLALKSAAGLVLRATHWVEGER
ncbi:MAG: response regulator transcription factor [Limisphaerales bacterium]